jgi:hypothetical protein
MGGVGVDVRGSDKVQIAFFVVSREIMHRIVHALYTPDRSSRYPQRIGRLLSVNSMQSHNGCGFNFSTDSQVGVLLVPTGIGVLKPPGNGLYLFKHSTPPRRLPYVDTHNMLATDVALTAQCGPVMWHKRFGYLNMQMLQGHHYNCVTTSPSMLSYAKHIFCDSC